MEENASMEKFPDEVLEEIFSRCTFDDLIWNIHDVNSRWRKISTRPKIWKNRTFTTKIEDGDEKIISVFKRCPRLWAVNFKSKGVNLKVLEALANNCADIVTIHFNDRQDISYKILNELQKKCPKIEVLTGNETILSCPEKLEIVGKFMNLRSVCSVSSVCDIVLKPLADGCPNLEVFSVGEMNVEIDDLSYFLLKKKDTLHTLALPCRSFRGANKCTIPCLSVCTALKSLYIHGRCENESMSLARTLGNLKTLKSLTWFNFHISNIYDFKTLFGCKNLAHLVQLEFRSFQSYSDDVTKIIVENCPNLQRLYLLKCRDFTDKTIEMLIHLKNLKQLGIYGNWNVLGVAMERLSYIRPLEYLLLGGCFGLTDLNLHFILHYKCLQVLKLEFMNIKSLPWHQFHDNLRALSQVGISCCKYLNVAALKAAKKKMPHVTFYVDVYSLKWAGYTDNQFE